MTEPCSFCGVAFAPQFAFQVAAQASGRRYFCSLDCRQRGLGETASVQKKARRFAVLNQKGGTGKTTTAINLAAGIAERGHEVLLIDLDAQGNVGISLGIRGDRTMYHLLVGEATWQEVAIPVRGHLDVMTSDATLAAAEVYLAQKQTGRDRVLSERLATLRGRYEYVIVDCGPSLSVLNQNALSLVDEVVIPVSCDYLALVGVKQVLRTLRDMERHLGHHVHIAGVVPTFYDLRTRLAREAIETLRGHFGERMFAPIRRSTRLAEAPSHRQTIFEYAPDSQGAQDYRDVIERLVVGAQAAIQPAAMTPPNSDLQTREQP